MDDKERIIKFEKELWLKGYRFIAGIDEAGRGPLAGPVVAAAVVFKPNTEPFLFKDSKKLNSNERKNFFKKILKTAASVGVGFADSFEIEELNIYRATVLAAQRAIENLSVKPDFFITDYLKIPGFSNLLPLPKGDERSFSCACASIVAKVVRDFIMEKLSAVFPEYGFERHKGYPTKFHIEAIKRFGITPVHRRNFARVKGEREGRGNNSFPISREERLLYYKEKLQELLRRN